ncbi:hypothetical protein [Streptomyces sp. NPDC059009]|uniref:hypothetical protein n=1 Tax=Streptomyces sp. NPDC059009 TaxID=3346694 RepID=UPI0036BB840F
MSTRLSRIRLRLAGRLAPVLGLLMMLMVPMVGIADAAPAASVTTQIPTDKGDCDLIKGTPGYKYCIEGEEKQDGKKGGGGSAKDDACSSLKGTPGYEFCRGDKSSPLDTITGDCKAAPDVEAPGDGILGWVDEGPSTKDMPPSRDPKAADADAYLYEQYGYAGLRWSTYDLGCGGALRDMGAASDNGFANKVFTWSKFWTALTVKMRQYAVSDGALDAMDPVVENATRAVRDAVYSPWIGISLLALGIVLILQARKRNLPDVLTQIVWALIVMALATGVASYPVQASKFADGAVNSTISAIDQAFASTDLNGNDADQPATAGSGATQAAYKPADPAIDPDTPGAPGNPVYPDESNAPAANTTHGNMLVKSVLYQQWLRGELGDDDSKVAKKYGVQLFDSQALTWRQNQLPADERSKVIAAKKKTFEELAEKIKAEDASAYENLTGKKEGRLGAAFISNFQSFASNTFSLLSDLIIIGGKIMIRFVVITFPALAVIGLHRRMQGSVRTSLNAVAAAVVNIPIFAVGGAIDVLMVRELADESVALPPWFKAVLMLLVTWVLWKICKPFTRLSAMVNPNSNWLADGGNALGGPGRFAKRYAQYYLVTRTMRKVMGRNTEAIDDLTDAIEGGAAGERGALGSGADEDDLQHGGSGRRGNGWWGNKGQPAADGTTGGQDGAGQDGGTQSGGLPLYADYERDEGQSAPDIYRPAQAGHASDDVWDAEGWYVEDLDPAAAKSGRSLPAANGGGRGGRVDDSDSLSAPSVPDGPAPLPGGSSGGGTAAELPSPRSNGQRPSDSASSGGTATLPAPDGALPTPPQGDRPYVQPEGGPTVVPPTLDEDGGQVYVIFNPDSGYQLRDERGQGPDDEER